MDDDRSATGRLNRRDLLGLAAATVAVASTTRGALQASDLPIPASAPLGNLAALRARVGDLNPASLAASKGLVFGSAISVQPLQTDPLYRATNLRDCNTFVHASAFQWHELQAQPDRPYNFANADTVCAYARAGRKAIRGHALLDWAGLPAWLPPQIIGGTAQQAADLLQDHVSQLVTRYRGQFIQWNVANEPLNSRGMRDYAWHQKLGEHYIDLAFQTAHQIDPRTPLAINQNLVESMGDGQPRTLQGLLALVQRLKGRGVPLRSVGIEGHLQSGNPINQNGLDDFFRQLARMDVSFMVTELDVSDKAFPGDPTARDADIGAMTRDFLDVCLAQPRCEGVIAWGLTDRYNWLVKDPKRGRSDGVPQRPTLLDANYGKKPVWDVVVDAIGRARGPGRYSIL
jgi:endo-1,4-beta-xylanase